MSDSGWTELSLKVAPAAVEVAADLLQEITGRGVTIEPAIEALGPDEGYTLDESAPLRVIAYFASALDDARRSGVLQRLGGSGLDDALIGEPAWTILREEDWAESWKAHYDIERVGRIVVRPAWRDYTPAGGEMVVSLDPGMAFGTGQHPTTRMCLEAAQDFLRRGDYVLDLGCGSGILAVAAVALGASAVIATDIEEQAVKASVENVVLNGMQAEITVREGSIDAAGDDGPFDLVLANINAATIIELASSIAAGMKVGAWLFAGGVIAEREAGTGEALGEAGLRIDRVMQDGDWRTFVCRRP